MSLLAKAGRSTILYVDHEVHNLISFIAIFRKDYRIISTSSLKEARLILEEEQVEIIICGEYLCRTSGVDFLASTLLKHGHCIRLLVSDYGNQDVENKAQIFNYLIKPWDETQLKKILKEAYELYISKQITPKGTW